MALQTLLGLIMPPSPATTFSRLLPSTLLQADP
jgi:hypothetical protein